jgi:peptidyl-prolyl cis-trans isomerase SurA
MGAMMKLVKQFMFLFIISVTYFSVAFTQEVIEGIVGVVGDSPITYSEVEERVSLMYMQGLLSDEEKGNQEIRRQIVQEMVNEKVLVEAAKRSGITILQDELEKAVENQINSVISGFQSKASFNEELRKQGLTLDELKTRYRKMLREKILQEKVIEKEVRSKVSVAEHEIKAFYDLNSELIPPAATRYKYAEIFVPAPIDSSNILMVTKELKEIKEKIESGQISFEKAAELYSDDSGNARKGGELGNVKFGTYMDDFENAIKRLKPGEISNPVKTRLGYHLILLERKDGKTSGNVVTGVHGSEYHLIGYSLAVLFNPYKSFILRENTIS